MWAPSCNHCVTVGLAAVLAISLTFAALQPASAAPLSTDHLEALERGCARGDAVQRSTCRRAALQRLADTGGALDLAGWPSGQRNALRLACVGFKDAGIEAFDTCLRRNASGATAGRLTALPTPAPTAPPERPMTTAAQAVFVGAAPSVLMVVATLPGGRTSQGSAVAVTNQLLVTNCHVIDGASNIRGRDRAGWRSLRIAAADVAADRCVLASERADLIPVRRTRSASSISIGEPVYTIGSPRGLFNTLGEGLVSGLRHIDDGLVIQVTAPIAPGSSGGGLFDSEGSLLGVTTFGIGQSGSLYFALAADEFATVLARARRP
jgi:S1-C subfamily serine protease